MNTTVFYHVNASLYFCMEGYHLLIDGLHEGGSSNFSPMPSCLDRDLESCEGIFANLDAALFTHFHRDHFSRSRVNKLLWKRPGLSVFAPDAGIFEGTKTDMALTNVPVTILEPDLLSFEIGPVRIFAIRNIHDGAAFYIEPHCSLLLQSGTESFFIAGDALLLPSGISVLKKYMQQPVTAAFVNAYQASTRSGQEFLRILAPQRTFLYHLPFPKDDRGNFLNWANQLHRHWPGYPPVPEVPELMSWIL